MLDHYKNEKRLKDTWKIWAELDEHHVEMARKAAIMREMAA